MHLHHLHVDDPDEGPWIEGSEDYAGNYTEN